MMFFCSSYLGKTRTDLKVFLPESEQYKRVQTRRFLACKDIKSQTSEWPVWLFLLYYICHLSRLAVTSASYSIARYLINVHYNIDLGTASLRGLPLWWLETFSKGPQFKKSVQIALAQLHVLKGEAMETIQKSLMALFLNGCCLTNCFCELLNQYWTSFAGPANYTAQTAH